MTERPGRPPAPSHRRPRPHGAGRLRRACRHPDNVWSLHGLHECLTRRGETVEANHIKQRLDLAQARADVPIESSCYCRMERAA